MCRWCKEPLIRKRGSWFELLLEFHFLRSYRCPHCYARYYLPALFCPRRKDAAERHVVHSPTKWASSRVLRVLFQQPIESDRRIYDPRVLASQFLARVRETWPAFGFVVSCAACIAVLVWLLPEPLAPLALLIGLCVGGYGFLVLSFQSLLSRQRATVRLVRRARSIVTKEFGVQSCPRCLGSRLTLTGCSHDGQSIEYTCSCNDEKHVAASLTPSAHRLASIWRQLAQMHVEVKFTATPVPPATAEEPSIGADAS